MPIRTAPPSASQQAASATLPAPVGGWDAEHAISDMPANRAYILDNWFPETDACRLRRGIDSYATGMLSTSRVDSLIVYNGLSTNKMFAATDNKIYDISTSGAIGAAVISTLINNRWEYINYGTAGGQFLLMVNGADTPRTFDGTTWANSTITGPTIANLAWITAHQRRIWVGEKNNLTAWYGPANTIGGAFTQFSLQGIARKGGYIQAAATWTRDTGEGADDFIVFVTSEGEAIVYQGTDPSAAATWAIVGVFSIGRPIGRRCLLNAGADLIIIVEDGFVPLSAVMSVDRAQIKDYAISKQINKAVNEAIIDFGTLDGWQPILYPRGSMLIFNIPYNSTVAYQYVFNTLTRAPCRFTGMNAASWAVYNGKLYFGTLTGGKVFQADVGNDDDDGNISADALQAFNDFGNSGIMKQFLQARPLFLASGTINVTVEINVDFNIKASTVVPTTLTTVASLWGTALWGTGLWTAEDAVYRGWYSVIGIGVYGSLRTRIATKSAQVRWVNTQYRYGPAGQV